MMKNKTDVIIIGAGLAGLNAARKLKKAGYSIKVLEARDRVGGRNLAHHLDDGKVLEMGGQWIGPTQTRMYELCEELGLKVYPTHNTGKILIYKKNGKKHYMGSAKNSRPNFNVLTLLALSRAADKFKKMANQIDLEAPWKHPKATLWDGESLESWIRKNISNSMAQDYFRLVAEAVFSTESTDMSLLHYLFYLKAGGGLNSILDVDEGAQQDRILGGTQQISIRLAAILGGDVVLNSPITRIEYTENGVKVFSRQQSWETQKVIVALPPTLAGRITYHPPLPGVRDQLTQRIPAGSVIKIQVIYKTPFWRKQGLTGQVASFKGPVKVVLDNSFENDPRGILVMFMEANDGRRASEWTKEKRIEKVIECLTNYFGTEAQNYEAYLEQNWMDEEFTRGCYGGHFTPGVWTGFGKHLRQPIGPIHWAGSETATVWNGYMEGAVRSGERAAKEVIEKLKLMIL